MLCSSSTIVFILSPLLFPLKLSLSRDPSDVPSCCLTSCFSPHTFILVFAIQSLLLSWTTHPHSLYDCFSCWFLIKFILWLSSLFELHLLIPISVSERNYYFCFDFASHLIWLLHLQIPFSWLPPPHLIYNNAVTMTACWTWQISLTSSF